MYNNTNHALTQVAPAEPGATLVIAAGSNGRPIGRPPVSPYSEAGRSEDVNKRQAVQWLVTGYMIVATIVVMCMAFMYRRFKLRPLYFAAAAFTLVGSVMGLFLSLIHI